MEDRGKGRILDKEGIDRIVMRMSHQILEKNKGVEGIVVVGIRNRGVYLAKRIANTISEIEKKNMPVGILDITLYRDDLSKIAEHPVVHKTEIDFDISDKKVVLVDDVLFTGRTARCAMDELIDFGRPRNIQLAVLIDRGHREFPIRADYVGKNVPTSFKDIVHVRLKEVDGVDEVVIEDNDARGPHNAGLR